MFRSFFVLLGAFILAAFQPVAAEEFRIEQAVVINASPQQAWAAFLSNDRESDIFPADSTVSMKIDLKPGGSIQTLVNDEVVAESEILSYDPARFISARYKTPATNGLNESWSVVYFSPVGDKKTRMVFVRLGVDRENEKLVASLKKANQRMADLFAERFGEAKQKD